MYGHRELSIDGCAVITVQILVATVAAIIIDPPSPTKKSSWDRVHDMLRERI